MIGLLCKALFILVYAINADVMFCVNRKGVDHRRDANHQGQLNS